MSTQEETKVLIVEDEEPLAELYKVWLDEEFSVEIALNGQLALEFLDDDLDIVLLDRRMPGLSGDEVLEILREREIGCPVVIVSAVTPDFDVIEMGFDDYLTKPITKEEMISTVKKTLDRSEYDKSIQEFYQLSNKAAILESNKPRRELEQNEEFQALKHRLEEKKAAINTEIDSFETDDFEEAFKRFKN